MIMIKTMMSIFPNQGPINVLTSKSSKLMLLRDELKMYCIVFQKEFIYIISKKAMAAINTKIAKINKYIKENLIRSVTIL